MKSIFLLTGFIYIFIGVFLYVGQRSFIYFPVAETKTDLNGKVFLNAGHEIQVTILNEGNENALLYFGGNAENVDFNAELFSKVFSDNTVYLVKYRGYGGSTGKPTEDGIYSDALHIYDTISNHYADISLVGRSLGSAVATYVAAEREIAKLVLITPFDSIQSIAQTQFPIYPMGLLLKDKHDSLSRAGKISAETLIITGEEDNVIDISYTKRLIDGFSIDVLLKIIPEVGHNNLSTNPHFSKILSEFI